MAAEPRREYADIVWKPAGPDPADPLGPKQVRIQQASTEVAVGEQDDRPCRKGAVARDQGTVGGLRPFGSHQLAEKSDPIEMDAANACDIHLIAEPGPLARRRDNIDAAAILQMAVGTPRYAARIEVGGSTGSKSGNARPVADDLRLLAERRNARGGQARRRECLSQLIRIGCRLHHVERAGLRKACKERRELRGNIGFS